MATMSRSTRTAKVVTAYEELAAALENARTGRDTEAKWEAVEAAAAIIHRQSRILAGKKRGG